MKKNKNLLKGVTMIVKKMPDNYQVFVRKPLPVKAIVMTENCEIITKEGTSQGNKGDYLVEGQKGNIYSCDKKAFEEIYELLDIGKEKEEKIEDDEISPRWRHETVKFIPGRFQIKPKRSRKKEK